MPSIQRTISAAALAVCIIALLERSSRNDGASCSSGEEQLFSCPNCGGMEVSDCGYCDGYLFTDERRGVCYDRTLFSGEGGDGFFWVDVIASIIWFITSGIATACGVGGGGIYVPLGILLLRFPPKSSSGLSQASIFGASLGGILVNIAKRHPYEYIRDTKGVPSQDHPGKIMSYEKNKGPAAIESDRAAYLEKGDGKRKFYKRPVIDYDMALFLAPMVMAGAVFGVILQRLFPDWLFLSLAVIVLGFTSLKTFQKFFSKRKKDQEERATFERLSMAESSIMNSEHKTEHDAKDGSTHYGTIEMKEMDSQKSDDDDDPIELEKRRYFLENDSRQYPLEKIANLVLLWIGLTVIIFLKGGEGVDSVIGVTCRDPGYHILLAAQFLWTLGFAAFFGVKNMKMSQAKQAVNYPFLETDVLWDAKGVTYYACVTFVAGIVAGLIGIGGGMILGPVMLVMGVHPSVSTATTASMVLLTSSSVAVMFVISGLVPWEYAVYFFSVALAGAYIGTARIDAYVKRTGMASILIGCLASIIGLATIGCLVILLLNLDKSGWCLDGFKAFCVDKNKEDGCPMRSMREIDLMVPH